MDRSELDKRIMKNRQPCLVPPILLHNYWTLLTGQVDELDDSPPAVEVMIAVTYNNPKRMQFCLPLTHRDTDST